MFSDLSKESENKLFPAHFTSQRASKFQKNIPARVGRRALE